MRARSSSRGFIAAVLCLLTSIPYAHAYGTGKNKLNEFNAAEMATPEAMTTNARKYRKGQGLGKIRESGFQRTLLEMCPPCMGMAIAMFEQE